MNTNTGETTMAVEMREGWFGVTRGGDGVPQEAVGPIGRRSEPGLPFGVTGRLWSASGIRAYGNTYGDIIATFPTRPEAEAYLRGEPEGKTLAQLDDIEDVAKARFMIDTGAVLIGETTNYPNACISEAIDLLDRALARMNHRAPTPPDNSRQERWPWASVSLDGFDEDGDEVSVDVSLAGDEFVMISCGDYSFSFTPGNAIALSEAMARYALMAEADKRMGG